MMTYFASAERTGDEDLQNEIDIISSSPVMSSLLNSVSGLLAVLDENRQILSLNDSFLELLGVENPKDVLGLRPGEALHCTYSDVEEGGCGTSSYCASCGAAIAIVSSMESGKPVEKKCSVTAEIDGKTMDLVLSVKSSPVEIEDKSFVLIFVQDITLAEKRLGLEKTFFHDFSNMITGLLGASDVLKYKGSDEKSAEIICQSARRMKSELDVQRVLMSDGLAEYSIRPESVPVTVIVDDLKRFFDKHPVAKNKSMTIAASDDLKVFTDYTLFQRVISNMIINAFEAVPPGGVININIYRYGISFCVSVWNEGVISGQVRKRIFQRNITTKKDPGRGLGTYSMKLFGEDFLGGEVNFTSSEDEGTEFTFCIPFREE